MSTNATDRTGLSDVEILARLLSNGNGRMPLAVARYLVKLEFSAEDKARMHELAVRNQDNDLSPEEKEELLAYANTGTILSILKSRARRVLRSKSHKRTSA
ncbi:MAG: hypothetical protein ACJ8F7_22335 [Gemmataceae bacterium]